MGMRGLQKWVQHNATLVNCLVVLIWLLLSGIKPASAQADSTDTAAVIPLAIEAVFQLSHQQFVQATQQLVESANKGCGARSDQAFSQLRADYQSVVSAFALIELYRIGPLTELLRQNRLFYWPDKRRVGERQLRKLLLDTSSSTLTEAELTKKSVALQGIPALERLLYGKNAAVKFDDEKIPDCHVTAIIAQNMHSMATSIDAEWSNQSDLVISMRNPSAGSSIFRNHQEVLQHLVTQIIVGIDIVLDKKIMPMVGDNADFKKAPLWLSEQTVTMIKGNLHGIRGLLIDSGLASATGLEDELRFEFRTVDTLLEKLKALPSLIDERGQLTTETLSLAKSLSAVVSGIKLTLNDRLVKTLGISAGFNSEDGD